MQNIQSPVNTVKSANPVTSKLATQEEDAEPAKPSSPAFDFPSLPPSPPPDIHKFSPTKMELQRSKEKQEKFEKINETKKHSRKSAAIHQGNQSNKREDFDTLKRPRSSSEKISPRKTENYQQGKSVKTETEIPAEPRRARTLPEPERKSRKQLEEEAWLPQSKSPATESRSRKKKRASDDICPKCHHKKGRIRSKSSDQHLKSVKVEGAVGLPPYDRDKEEMELLKRYIRSEEAHIEVRECSCVQTNIDFNRQFQFDSKRKSRAKSRHNKFDF